MGHDKLRKFAENESFDCLLQPSAKDILADGFFALRDDPVKGHWADFFARRRGETNGAPLAFSDGINDGLSESSELCGRNDREDSVESSSAGSGKVILELGCGKGEYTIDLALRNPQDNFIGVDIKGARLWKGAKYATEHKLGNVAFLRTRVEFIEAFFAPGEVDEIWLTFSDPQHKSENSRLTSPMFLERYRKFLKPGGVIHLKTDSRFLYEYTSAVCAANGLQVLDSTSDLYAREHEQTSLYEVQTFYEKLFLSHGYKICYLAFTLSEAASADSSSSDVPVASAETGGRAFRSPSDPEEFDSKYWLEVEGPRRSVDFL